MAEVLNIKQNENTNHLSAKVDIFLTNFTVENILQEVKII